MKRLSALPVVLALVITACSTPVDDDPTSSTTPGPYLQAVNYSIFGNPTSLKEGRTTEEMNALIQQNFVPLSQTVPGTDMLYMFYFRSDQPLEAKDRAAATLIDAHPGPDWLHLRQMVAAPMLELHLRNGSDNLDAIERYTQILVDAENPSTDLFAEALPLLRDRWTQTRRQQAARVSVGAATDWLAKTCTDCTARRAMQAAEETGETAAKRQAVTDALGPLSALANG